MGAPDEDLTVEKCVEMIAGVDKDGDSVISFDEFKAMTTTKTKDTDTELMRVFKSFDTDADGRISASEIQKLRRCTTTEAKEMVADDPQV
ncbi:hypothetical protein QYE76_055038 [Lolium multiflorum]|uniref:EF-hand domain-containing protein n=1 Tax=Lolium multiflorum TaxID=4521 RepID=A0AAD8WLK0_LOLMU|nr:hypothetical protein QYE76_055038 [Lolium multiflorum]